MATEQTMTTEQKITKELRTLTWKIEDEEKYLRNAINHLYANLEVYRYQDFAQQVYSITEFVPGTIAEIERLNNKLVELYRNKDQLEYILREDSDEKEEQSNGYI